MNELDLIKLNIFEAFDNGEITYGEKEYLLEQVDYMYEEYKKMTLKDLNPDDFPDNYPDDETVVNNQVNNHRTYDSTIPPDNNTSVNNKQPNNIHNNNTSTTSKGLSKGAKIGIGAGVAAAGLTAAAGLYKGSKALNKSIQNRNLKKKYDKAVDDLLKTKSELETQLKNSKNVRERIILTKQIKDIEKQIKVLENESDNQLNKEVKESTFDLLLESINDLYDED